MDYNLLLVVVRGGDGRRYFGVLQDLRRELDERLRRRRARTVQLHLSECASIHWLAVQELHGEEWAC